MVSKSISGIVLFVTIGVLAMQCNNNSKVTTKSEDAQVFLYPETYMDTTVSDDYFGTKIADPYRWLENDHSDETVDWVKRQNDVSFAYLEEISFRKDVRDRMEQLVNFEKFSVPFKGKHNYYYYKNDGLQNQDVLYTTPDLKSTASVLIDPNTFSKTGTSSLGAISESNDGKYMGFSVSEGGSDWQSIYVKELATGTILKDTIKWVKFSGISWWKDGFFYGRYPEPLKEEKLSAKNAYHKVYYHKVGDDQSKDKLVYEDQKNPSRNAYIGVSDDERFMVMSGSESTSGNSLAIKKLSEPNAKFTWLVSNFENDYEFIENIDDDLYIKTNDSSSNWKIIKVNANKPQKSNWQTIIPTSDKVISAARLLGGRLFVTYMENAAHIISVFDLSGKELGKVSLPEIGSVSGLSGKKDSEEAFYGFTSFVRPNTVYKLNTNTFQSELYFAPKVDFDPDDFTTEQVWYNSKDGTRVPMFISYKKSLKKDGKAPTLLYGYGGFDISLLPSFSVSKIVLMESGGVYAVANIRGGGEFGKDWHLAGTKERKQNVFDDFIAAGEYLISSKYTSKDRLAIEGGSNGGLLVGACINQRPDLFKVAFPKVGVLDMLRYHKFTIGWAWATDYGTSDTKEGFEYLSKYSPVHNTKPSAYPATMIMTADHDDRVVPAHSFKFAAALQKHNTGPNPTLIRIDVAAGHGAGKSTKMRIDEVADQLSFMYYNMGINPKFSPHKN